MRDKAIFFLNGALFMLGGILLMGDGKVIFGLLQFIAALLNFSMLIKFKDERIKTKLNIGVLIMNVIVALSVSLDYFLSGKKYIQYAWIIVAIMSYVALHVQYKKMKRLSAKG